MDKMILPYKWKISVTWNTTFTTWVIAGIFVAGKQEWRLSLYEDDKEDLSEIYEMLWTFWRKRGAM